MADAQRLTLAFLGSHGVEAARVIEALPAADAVGLFAEIPARIGAPVLAAMLPTSAARIVSLLDEELALAMLTASGTQAAVGILRHITEPARSRLIAALPTVTAVASRILLGFPEDAVGAWTDPEVIALAPAALVSDALVRVRQGQAFDVDHVYVVDAERRLLGRVSLHALVRVADNASLATLVKPTPDALAALMPVASAAGMTAWERTAVLPVIDRDGRLIGVLRKTALTRALNDRLRNPRAAENTSVIGVIGAGYWGIVSGLAATTLAVLPQTRRVLPEDA